MRGFPVCALRSARPKPSSARPAQERLTTIVLCPGMVVGPRDPKPTSTRLLRVLARTWVAFLPQGGIPIVDAAVVARAHRRACHRGAAGPALCRRRPLPELPRACSRSWRRSPESPGTSFPCRTAGEPAEGRCPCVRAPWPPGRILAHDRGRRFSASARFRQPGRRVLRPGASLGAGNDSSGSRRRVCQMNDSTSSPI